MFIIIMDPLYHKYLVIILVVYITTDLACIISAMVQQCILSQSTVTFVVSVYTLTLLLYQCDVI